MGPQGVVLAHGGVAWRRMGAPGVVGTRAATRMFTYIYIYIYIYTHTCVYICIHMLRI